jgi:hypothetical protein
MKSPLRLWLMITILLLLGCAAVKQENSMNVNVDAISKLQALAERDNFAPNGMLYSGVRDLTLRADLNSRFRLTIAHFITATQRKSKKDEYLALLASEIKNFERLDLGTEDAEQVGTNFEHIMDCIGLDSSDGILNNWMYGFDPKKL